MEYFTIHFAKSYRPQDLATVLSVEEKTKDTEPEVLPNIISLYRDGCALQLFTEDRADLELPP